jgi:integrase
MAKFTDRTIAALRPRPQRYEVWDDARSGFGIRITPRGVKSFVWVYHFEGRPRRLTFGTYPALTLGAANLKLAHARQALARGEDPGTAAVSERVAERAAETIADLVADYLERYARPRKRSAAEDERILRKDILPRWGARKVNSITRRGVVTLRNDIVDRGAPIQANRTFGILRRMFKFAISQAMVETSPCDKVERPSSENQRDRTLTETEIRQLWSALEEAPMEPNARRVLRFMLATGQRRGEVIGLHVQEVDYAKNIWMLPAARSKNGMEHLIPLSPLALQILSDATPNEEGYLFASKLTAAPYRGQSIAHAVGHLFEVRRQSQARKKTAKADAPLPPLAGKMDRFTPHDLRRSVATRMRELGISRGDVKMVLNHRERDVTARYDRYDGLPEKKRALEIWGARLAEIIAGTPAGANVIELARS